MSCWARCRKGRGLAERKRACHVFKQTLIALADPREKPNSINLNLEVFRDVTSSASSREAITEAFYLPKVRLEKRERDGRRETWLITSFL